MARGNRIPAFLLALGIGGAVLALGCSDGTNEPSGPTANLQIVHSVRSVLTVDVMVDGEVALSDVPYGSARLAAVPTGSREVTIRPSGATATPGGAVMTFVEGDTVTILTVDSSTVINPWTLTDTGSVVPSDKSKLRVVHFAASEPTLDILRTQPDWPTPIGVMFPFDYQAVSAYLQSDPGTWEVFVSSWSGGVPELSDTLLATGPIEVPAGESRTVVILDGAGGGLQYEVITP